MSVDTGLDEAAAAELELDAAPNRGWWDPRRARRGRGHGGGRGGRGGRRLAANPDLEDSGVDLRFVPPRPPDYELRLRLTLFLLLLLLPALALGAALGSTVALGVWASCWQQSLSFTLICVLALFLILVYYWKSARDLLARLNREWKSRSRRRTAGGRGRGRRAIHPFFPGLYIVGFFIYLVVLNALYPLTSNHVAIICAPPNNSDAFLLSSKISADTIFTSNNTQPVTAASSRQVLHGRALRDDPSWVSMLPPYQQWRRNRSSRASVFNPAPRTDNFQRDRLTASRFQSETPRVSTSISSDSTNQSTHRTYNPRLCRAMHVLRVIAVAISVSAALCVAHFVYDTWSSRKAHLPTAPKLAVFLSAAEEPDNRAGHQGRAQRRCCCCCMCACTDRCASWRACVACRRMAFMLCWVFAVFGWTLYPRRYSPPQRSLHTRQRAGAAGGEAGGAANGQNADSVSDQVDIV